MKGRYDNMAVLDVIDYLDKFTHEFTDVILEKMKNENIFKEGEEFYESATFDFDQDIYELPLKSFTEEELDRIDPNHRIIKDSNSDLYLLIKNEIGFPYLKCVVKDNVSDPRYYNLKYSEGVSITENADFVVEGYDDKGKFGHLCGFSKTQSFAEDIAAFAANVNFSKGTSEINKIVVTDYDSEKTILFHDFNGRHLPKEKQSVEKGMSV